MFSIGDVVMYGSSGVFSITDIRQEKFGEKPELYYVLNHREQHDMVVYCPVNNPKIPMRRLLSKEEIYALIRTMPNAEGEWIDDDRERNRAFTEILRSGDREALVRLVKTLYYKKQERLSERRKLRVSDEKLLKEAETILHEEFAHVLDIRTDEVLPFILGELGEV